MDSLEFPLDEFNQELLHEIFPKDRTNPKAAELYDLVVIGAGPGGMVSALIAAQMNKRVALVEKAHMGGECLSAGCIPSKAMLRCSKFIDEVKRAKEFGVDIAEWSVNFEAVMKRVRRLRSEISKDDSVELFAKLGLDIFLGSGEFTGLDTVQVDGQTLKFKKAIIAAGTQPLILPIPGLIESGYLTNQTIFNLTKLPKHLAVIGAGPISCELAQAFTRFGSKVSIITHGPRILSHEDNTAIERLLKVFEKEGIKVYFNSNVTKVEKRDQEKVVYFDGNPKGLVVDEILMAVGRVPVVHGLGLEQAHVAYDEKKGIIADDFLKTTNPNVFLVGDMQYKFTHISKEEAKIAVNNAFGGLNLKRSDLVVPWCMFTDPEIAHVGITEFDAAKQGIEIETYLYELDENIRANLDAQNSGFLKIHVKPGTDQILGATLMAAHAGEMISEITVAIVGKLGLTGLIKAIHPFPTQSESFRTASELLLKKRLKPLVGVAH